MAASVGLLLATPRQVEGFNMSKGKNVLIFLYRADGFDQNGINIVGHTDSTGSQELNMRLSRERATSVASYLSGQGVSGARISSAGVGPSQPIASNDTAQGKAENRRVSVNILVSKGLDGM